MPRGKPPAVPPIAVSKTGDQQWLLFVFALPDAYTERADVERSGFDATERA